MYINNRITRSLCAVILSISLLLSQSAFAAEGEGQAALDPSYVYAIDIEFGNLAFYYDYGVWNVNTMRYEASETSTDPAIGTAAGFPGWYGFDGTSNLIKVTNRSTGGYAVDFSLSYRSLTESEWVGAGVMESVSDVAMTVVDKNGDPLKKTTQVAADAETPAEWYIHLQGEPHVDGGVYSSDTMNPIGMLTLKIDAWE